MTKIDNFFLEMESLFQKNDLEAFREIKEDILEHILIQLDEGLGEEEILARLGQPKDIVDGFYAEKRLHTAFNSDSDVVPLENVREVYLERRKEKHHQLFDKFLGVIKVIVQIFLTVLTIYATAYVIFELISERHIAVIPCLLLIISLFTIFLFFSTKIYRFTKVSTRKKLIVLFPLAVIVLFNLDNKNLLYQGKEVSNELIVDGKEIKEIIIKSDFEVNLTVIPNPNSSDIVFYIKGNGKRNLTKHLEDNDAVSSNKIKLDLGMENIFDLFSDIKTLQITMAIPTNVKNKDLQLSFKEANIQLQDSTLNDVSLKLTNGLLSTKRLEASSVDIESKHAGIIMNNFNSFLNLKTETGKVILKNGVGNVKLQTKSGLSNFIKLTADKVSLDTNDGKVVITDTTIKELDIFSHSDTVVLENQIGKSNLTLDEGKLIATNNKDELIVNSHEAAVIILQNEPILGSIKNDVGLVKWVQPSLVPINFDLKSTAGEIVDERSNSKKVKKQASFKIITNTGDINIYDQVILDELIPESK